MSTSVSARHPALLVCCAAISIALALVCPSSARVVALEARPPIEQSKERLDAVNAAADARRLQAAGTPEGRRDAAVKFEEAVRLFRAASDRRGEIQTLMELGNLYRALFDWQKALGAYHAARQVSQSIGDPQSERRALVGLFNTFYNLGDFQKRLEYTLQELDLGRRAGDRLLVARALNDVGNSYLILADYPKALDYYARALLQYRGSNAAENEVTGVMSNIGEARLLLGDYAAALQQFDKVLPVWRRTGYAGGESGALQLSGQAYLSLGEPKKALERLLEAWPLSRTAEWYAGEAYILRYLGGAYAALKQYDDALASFNKALALNRDRQDPEIQIESLWGLARVERDRGRFREARGHVESAVDVIESQRLRITHPQLRASWSAWAQKTFELYIDVLMHLHAQEPNAGHHLSAFHVSERARARSLLEMLGEARGDVVRSLDPALRRRADEVQSTLALVQGQLLQARALSAPDARAIRQLEEVLKRAEDDVDRIDAQIWPQDARHAEASLQRLPALQEWLDDRTAVLEYALGEQGSWLFAVTRDDFLVARVPTSSVLQARVRKLRESLAGGPSRLRLGGYVFEARALYRELIEPARHLIAGKQALIIVPDGVLHYLPYEVLQADGPSTSDVTRWPYLLRNYSISYAPSASVLASLRRHRAETTKRADSFVAFADPDYGPRPPEESSAVSVAVRGALGANWRFTRLPNTRQEVTRISRFFPPENVRLFLGHQAREEAVKADEALSHYRYVHFAVHGLLNDNNASYSGLVLSLPSLKEAAGRRSLPSLTPNDYESRAPSLRVEDGLLQVYEILNLKLSADLVVLSACETGLGKQVRGEGILGLTRAFLYAGTPSVVVSLWKVGDLSTSELMVRFYRRLKDRVSKAEALRQARLDLIHEGRFAHPYYWAPFVLVGQSN